MKPLIEDLHRIAAARDFRYWQILDYNPDLINVSQSLLDALRS